MGRTLPILAFALAAAVALADGPKDNIPDDVRPIPPKGSSVPVADLAELRAGLAELRAAIDAVPLKYGAEHPLAALVPDVEIYHKAVRYAVEYDEMYIDKNRNDVTASKALLKQGLERAKQLLANAPKWTTQTGLVVRGYRSKIDGSVQPYGLVVPDDYNFHHRVVTAHRLDLWWHGRGELLTEVNFIDGRQKNRGEFTPAGAFVLHPYGRYCNANKFAGEVDTFEAIDHAKKHYRIDASRIVARGFSMGGAACWQFATHFPTYWCAAAPGAGFAETPEFLNVFQNEKVEPTWYEQRLWRMYNATDHAQNLFNLPTVAYSGETDRQKQAADVMAREMKKVGLDLVHVIGPKTAHSYEKGAKVEINRRIDEIAGKGLDPLPAEIKFVTYTLRYNRCAWVTVEVLAKHWEKASVAGSYTDGKVALRTEGVTALGIPLSIQEGKLTRVEIDGQPVWAAGNNPAASAIQVLSLLKIDGRWHTATKRPEPDTSLIKQHGLQGPIDDAFMDRFLMVKPTGTPLNAKVGDWAAAEMKHAVAHWRSHFRGDAPVKDDTGVTANDIDNANLVLWGEPASNAVLAKIADKLPVKWTKDGVTVGDRTFPAGTHVPVLIYPNPLNPKKYVVLNSGFTFREYDYLNNARQVPKLPDYAVIDTTTPPNSRYPGKVVRAGFFGEKWELLPNDGR